MQSKFLKSKKPRGSVEASGSDSSDEMEIIANFIENVEVTEAREAPDQESTDEYSVSEDPVSSSDGHGVKSLAWRMTSGSKWSSRQRKPAAATPSDVSNEYDKTNPQPTAKRSSRKSKRPKRIIQDMIDMSLGKKKAQSSEKMLRIAFVEFYRGLGLLKSYRCLLYLDIVVTMPAYDLVI